VDDGEPVCVADQRRVWNVDVLAGVVANLGVAEGLVIVEVGANHFEVQTGRTVAGRGAVVNHSGVACSTQVITVAAGIGDPISAVGRSTEPPTPQQRRRAV
jgi:hypothetical protein